jgi:hypothetical protein
MAASLWLDLEDERWNDLLAASAAHDVYHTQAYHRLARLAGEGEPHLFAWCEGEAFIALPFLARPLSGIAGLEEEAGLDATSVYGYPGPVMSKPPLPSGMPERFQKALLETCENEGIVSLFSRVHPLLEEETALLGGLGELVSHGLTVSVDLTLPEEEQFRRYRRDHRAGVRKLKAAGFTCRVDEDLDLLARFAELYHENMERVGASDYYFFSETYFAQLREWLGDRLTLIACEREGDLACAALFFETAGIVQYHLSATAAAYLKAAPAKLMLDFARCTFTARGARVLHLGSGLGGEEDSLLLFKAGFSDRRHPFRSWRLIVSPERYRHLCDRRATVRDLAAIAAGFFPRYRG